MPRVAVTTGPCDQLGCMIPKLGVDPAEMGVAGQDKAFIYFRGRSDMLGPPNMPDAATALWQKPDELKKYDMILNSCLCAEQRTYKGRGRVRRRHQVGQQRRPHVRQPLLVRLAEVQPRAGAGPPASSRRTGSSAAPTGPIKIDTTFPKGKALADWMKFLDPALTYGEVAAPGHLRQPQRHGRPGVGHLAHQPRGFPRCPAARRRACRWPWTARASSP